MFRRATQAALLTLALAGLSAGWAPAEEAPLTVGVKHAPPFVILDGDADPLGLSVDLIRAVAERMHPPRTLRFVAHPSLKAHLEAVAAGEVDLGIAATTVTAKRAETLDFSPPIFTSGLGIVVPAHDETSLLQVFLTPGAAKVALAVALYVLLCALLIWAIERGGVFSASFKAGLPEAIWWTLVTMSTVGYGDYAPRRPAGRVLAGVVIFSGIALFGVLVAEVTSLVTLAELRPSIQTESDLERRRVGVLEDTIAAEVLAKRKLTLVAFASLDEAFAAARAGRVDAVVHDRPLLRYRLQDDPDGLILVGGAFQIQDYAIAFPLDSPLRRPVNQALLQVREEAKQETYNALIARWLGDDG